MIYLPNYSKTNKLETKADLYSCSKSSHASLPGFLGCLGTGKGRQGSEREPRRGRWGAGMYLNSGNWHRGMGQRDGAGGTRDGQIAGRAERCRMGMKR